jgi:hypothetical protein
MSTDQNPNHMQSFIKYAMAFEEAYASDDWKVVDDLLADNISWVVEGVEAPIGGIFFGREPVINAMRSSCNTFDRRFDTRLPATTATPIEIPGGVYFPFTVTYRHPGLPDAHLNGLEWDFFVDGKLALHREIILNAQEVLAFVETHDAKLRDKVAPAE